MSEAPFSISSTDVGLTFAGELDSVATGSIRAALASFNGATVRVDCSAVTFMDSSAIGAILAAAARGVDVQIVHASWVVRRVFEIVGITHLIVD